MKLNENLSYLMLGEDEETPVTPAVDEDDADAELDDEDEDKDEDEADSDDDSSGE